MNDDKWTEARRKALEYASSLSDEDDARRDAAAKNVPDAKPWTDEMWPRAEMFDERQKRQRRRAKNPAETPAAGDAALDDELQIDAEVLEHVRKTGRGWQSRINDLLRKAAGLSRN